LLGIACALWGETDLDKAARLIKESSFQEAQAILDRIVRIEPRNAEAWYRMGEVQWATRNAEQTVECADKAIAIDPTRADYHLLRGAALGNLAQNAGKFRALGLASDSRKSMEKAVQLEPGNRNAVRALFNFYLNVPSIAGGSLDKAEALADRTRTLDPSRGHYLKGLVLQRRKDPNAALAEYRSAITADPQYSEAYNALGYVELELKQVDSALGHFQKLVEISPDEANYLDSLGDGWMAKGNMDEAMTAYRKALSLNPVLLPSLRSLGTALERAGRRDEAIQHYRQCVQLGTQKNIPQIVDESKKRLKALGVKE
jgi:tetratricopeptide (TPR) repeat protein